MERLLKLGIVLSCCVCCGLSAKFLVINTGYAFTHVKLIFSLTKELVRRGHQVTTIRKATD